MTTATIVALIALGVLSLVLIPIVVAKLVLRQLQGPLEARVAAEYRPEDVVLKDLGANTFGLESWGVWQGRGNGALVLTRDELHFFRFVRGGDVRVPLAAITEVTFTKTHLGKATIFDLLKVRFSADGKSDSVAWYVADPREWKDRIEDLRSQGPSSPRPVGNG
jgi:hypothetical protein